MPFMKAATVLCLGLLFLGFTGQQAGKDKKETPKKVEAKKMEAGKDVKKQTPPKQISFTKDVMPVFRSYCLPCHAEERMSPSELYLDTYANIMNGGKHGAAVVPGKADSSHLVLKVNPDPPFGDPMPKKFKRQFPQDTLQILRDWINQGAKNN